VSIRQDGTWEQRVTPVGAAGRGLAAGLVATLLLSALARVLPGMRRGLGGGEKDPGTPAAPSDPFDADAVRMWQERSQSPAAFRRPDDGGGRTNAGRHGAELPAARSTPAGALAQPLAPGPEGLAAQFAFKVASGVFNRDITPIARRAGTAVHFAYGGFWGVVYGLLQGSYRRPPGVLGAAYGLLVWVVGPAALVPAMKLMRPPRQEPPGRTAMMGAGHVTYGLALAAAFEALEREGR
jgi:hypothetical protein